MRPRVTAKARGAAGVVGAAALLLAAACSGPELALPDRDPVSGRWAAALAPTPLLARALPATRDGFARDGGAILIASDGWCVPDVRLSEDQREGLAGFVQRGGRLVLFGYAAALAAELGVEPEQPESEPLRWGFDARTAIGRARIGVQVVSGREPELFAGLAPSAAHAHTFLLAGGAPCCAPVCCWAIGEPQRGEVLARLAVEYDGALSAARAAVVVRWQFGRGEVLACGLQPEFEHADAELRANGTALAKAGVAWLLRGRAGPAVFHPLRGPAPDEVPEPALPLREFPGAPLLAHWGWQAPLRDLDGPGEGPLGARGADELLADVLLPSWRAGADLVELDPIDPDRGAPLAWRADDPLRRPESWRGGAFWAEWPAAAFGAFAREGHARGLLVSAMVDPLPVGERPAERLVALRHLARELACVRRLGAGALDGFGVRGWFADASGFGPSLLQDFHPGAWLYGAGEAVPPIAGALRALDADDGTPRGLAAAGLSDVWRAGFPADLFPLGVLDARAARARPHVAGHALGGGSHGDWIATQANDFVRARRGAGGALLWRAHVPALLGRDAEAYVLGVSLEPLRAAVAAPLSATGKGGYRSAQAALLPEVQAGFGAELPVPAAVHALQNNWFRLLGSGGGLLFDRDGLARFRPGEAATLSPAFVRTRIYGGRPDGSAMRSEAIDLLAEGHRGEGGYGAVVQVGGPRREDRQLPAQLAFDELPRWPQRASIELQAGAGYHELELLLRAVRGRGIAAVSLDGTVLQCVPFAADRRPEPVVVPVHLARSEHRVLQIEVADSGAVAVDRLRLVRRDDVAAEAQVLVPAGSFAQLRERSQSSYHQEELDVVAVADLPAFVLRVRCERAVRNLQVERSFQFPLHRELAAVAPGEDARGLRAPFALRAGDRALPDVVVVPLQLQRYEKFVLRDGALLLHSAPEPGVESRVGFLFAAHGTGAAVLPHAATMLAGLDRPIELDLGERGEASLPSDLPVAWTRLVHLRQDARTPYLVRENGWWLWRGAQRAPAGGDWLRVWQLPGDVVQVSGGPGVFARTRPGPGSLRTVALRDPEPAGVTVRVLQRSRLAPPSVVMGADFASVTVDDAPWRWFDGRTVFLPDRVGTYRVRTRSHGGDGQPHVACTRAPLVECAYAADRRELRLVTAGDERPVEMPFTALLRGPRPVRVENGEIVAEDELRHADAVATAQAAAGGAILRFRAGTTRVFYGE